MSYFSHRNINLRALMLASALLAAILPFLFLSTDARAQTYYDLSLQMSPENPGPYQDVTATIVSYTLNLDSAGIRLVLDGKNALSGTGKKQLSFKTGGIGSASKISVYVSVNGINTSRTAVVSPGSIDLLWQVADGYAPPFYRGKILPSPQSLIKIVAMPNIVSGGTALKSSSLVYSWSRNYNAVPEVSGYGKNTYTFKNSYLDAEENISVSASASSGGSAENKITIPMDQPFVLFYENNPLQGVKYEQALGSVSMFNNEIKISAEPFFFSAPDKKSSGLSYSWTINNSPASAAPGDKSSVVLRNNGDSGTSNLSVSMSNYGKVLQAASNSMNINFGQR